MGTALAHAFEAVGVRVAAVASRRDTNAAALVVGGAALALTGAIAAAALVIGGAMLVTAPLGGWHHILGEMMVVAGSFGTILISGGMLRRDRGRGRGRR